MEDSYINKELIEKTDSMLPNQQEFDIDKSISTFLTYYRNYSNGIVSQINDRVCFYREIDTNSEQGKEFNNIIAGFISDTLDYLIEVLDNKVSEIKQNLVGISVDDYNKRLSSMITVISNKMHDYYGENIDKLIKSLTENVSDNVKDRISNYLLMMIEGKMNNNLVSNLLNYTKVIDNNNRVNIEKQQSIEENTLKRV